MGFKGHKSTCKKSFTRSGRTKDDGKANATGGAGSSGDTTESEAAVEYTCYVCLDSDDALIPLGCACRGEGGKAHLQCIIDAHAARDGDVYKMSHWIQCLICKETYTGKMHSGVSKDLVRRYKHIPDFMSIGLTSRHADSMSQEGRHREAEVIYRKCIGLHTMLYQQDTEENLVLVNNLAQSLRAQCKYKEAIALFRENLKNYIKLEGTEGKHVLFSQQELATSLKMDFQYAEAEHWFRKTVATMKRTHSETDMHYIMARSGLAALLCDGLKKPAEAEVIFRKLLAIQNRILGPEHPQTLVDLTNLATALRGQGKHAESIAVSRDFVKKKGNSLGAAHPDSLQAAVYLSTHLRAFGQMVEAKAVLVDALALCGDGAHVKEIKRIIQSLLVDR